MKYTTATFAAAMANVLPAITFVIACFFRLEKVKITNIRSQAKIIGTLATVAGAMIMTLITGPNLDMPWTKQGPAHDQHQQTQVTLQDSIKGAVMITVGTLSWACFMILQGVFCSGIAYYVQGVVMKERGPVFVTAFSPLSMVIVAILSSFILAEQMYLGRVVGAIVIVMGLYFVVWGKRKDYETPRVEEKEIPIKQGTNMSNGGSLVDSKLEVVTTGEQKGEAPN
ncbi:nodulin MtN21 /EamA-like transporter family protein [Striga asiatica]|uniref:WAT1-related protein n=1 Tax=Striga asiatica TaxID=4170 RepID=A0A5A7P7V5_STRAF|nr:nodulin MtN21 /EamA-like transporter family protein [Striga asiatica]